MKHIVGVQYTVGIGHTVGIWEDYTCPSLIVAIQTHHKFKVFLPAGKTIIVGPMVFLMV